MTATLTHRASVARDRSSHVREASSRSSPRTHGSRSLTTHLRHCPTPTTNVSSVSPRLLPIHVAPAAVIVNPLDGAELFRSGTGSAWLHVMVDAVPAQAVVQSCST